MSNLRAALTLTFQDQLSPGLDRLKVGLEAIGRIGRNISLHGLDNADRTLRGAADGASALSRSLSLVASTADHATSAIQRAGQAARHWGSQTFGANSRMGAFAAAASGYSLKMPLESWSAHSSLLRGGSIASGQYGPDADRFMKEWRAYYNNLARETGQGSHPLADVGFWMFFNGLSGDQIKSTLPGMAKLATTYKADVKDVARVSEGLLFSMKIKPEDIERALGVMALLGKEGGFQFSDQAAHMPKVLSAAGMLGMKGMGGLEELAAAMQLQLKAGSDREPGEAATKLKDFLVKLDLEDTRKKFAEHKVDIRAVLADATKTGRSRMLAGLAAIQEVQRRVAAKNKITNAADREASDGNVINDLFGDEQAKFGAGVLLNNLGELLRLIGLAKGINVADLGKDFGERIRDDETGLNSLKESAVQTGDRIGSALMPAVRVANAGLERMRIVVAGADAKYPNLIDHTILATGSLLAIGAVLGVLGVAAPVVAAGFSMLAGVLGFVVSPLGAALALLAGGAYYVMTNWDRFGPFFSDIWDGTKRIFLGFTKWLNSTLKLDHVAARDGLIEVWEGGKTLFSAALGLWKLAFTDLIQTLDGWTGGAITATFERIAAAIGAGVGQLKAFIEELSKLPDGMFSGDGASRATPNTPPGYAPPGETPSGPGGGNILEIPPLWRQSFSPGGGMGGTIFIRAEPGTTITRTEGDTRGVTINPGAVLGRA